MARENEMKTHQQYIETEPKYQGEFNWEMKMYKDELKAQVHYYAESGSIIHGIDAYNEYCKQQLEEFGY